MKSETGMSRQGFLLILLVIIAAAGCTFFFTDLLRQGNDAETTTAQGSLVKKPMPPRPISTIAASAAKPAVEQSVVAVIPEHDGGAVKSAPLKVPMGKKTSPPQQVAANQSPVKSESAKLGKEHAIQKTPAKSAAGSKPDLVAESAREPDKTAKKQEDIGRDKKFAKTAPGRAKGAYTLLVGVFVMEKSMREVKGKLKSAGLSPFVSKGPKKEEPMNRLFMGEFDSYPEASIELKRISKITHDAFILPENGKYTLYGGSYYVKESAEKQRDRLCDAGFKPILKQINVPVNTYRLTAGNFQSSKPAEAEAERLKKLGVKVSVVKSGT